jgi:hypothetical protein
MAGLWRWRQASGGGARGCLCDGVGRTGQSASGSVVVGAAGAQDGGAISATIGERQQPVCARIWQIGHSCPAMGAGPWCGLPWAGPGGGHPMCGLTSATSPAAPAAGGIGANMTTSCTRSATAPAAAPIRRYRRRAPERGEGTGIRWRRAGIGRGFDRVRIAHHSALARPAHAASAPHPAPPRPNLGLPSGGVMIDRARADLGGRRGRVAQR